jgi:hypothetical protein
MGAIEDGKMDLDAMRAEAKAHISNACHLLEKAQASLKYDPETGDELEHGSSAFEEEISYINEAMEILRWRI